MAHGRLVLPLLAILALGPTPAHAQGTLKLGFFAPLTGFAAADGASARHAAEIAVEELNAAGGIKGKKVGLAIIVLGGLIVGVVETLVIGLVDFPLPRDARAFLAMIAVFLARPQGLLGVK